MIKHRHKSASFIIDESSYTLECTTTLSIRPTYRDFNFASVWFENAYLRSENGVSADLLLSYK